MITQNYANHRRYVLAYHVILFLLLLTGLVSSIINVARQSGTSGFMGSLLILLLFICAGLIYWLMRVFPLKAQDRAIRAEESLRYFILTRQPLDKKLTISQIAALRFAPDDELLPLVDRAVKENLLPDVIKKAIKNWRADDHRV